ncbi:YifB family Mg chelatase-like AAA ATPase [Corynebacterium sp. Marseille-P4321]|uniref:YifB family Mg chelatase-like AAA ATPase n=1 Tax=Corynebacterium sp. Marseille-P4321 TaxID=2736603 RepID=UPI00158D7C53|nr:YifB family Mg chelatase-like AAA ATPase [Corynebacterium sp. Marseille-P4321]
MALASTLSATVEGVSARVVTVEANVGPGLPGMHMVGLGDAAVKESRERIRTAISNSALPWPRTKIMVSLSPAHLPKAGSHFDLPIAAAVLGSLDPRAQRTLAATMLLGELALDGTLRRVEGVLPMLVAALIDATGRAKPTTVVVPRANAEEAALIGGGRILVADTLAEVWAWLTGAGDLETVQGPIRPEPARAVPDFRDVAGMRFERHALEVAAAGGHHVMMVGPPGSGKSMLAERLPSILPPMDIAEMVEVTSLHSVAGLSHGRVVSQRPFIAPHPSLTKAALIGGGSGTPMPGVVSQAHNGVLFLDEVSEIPAHVLDALRIPLEKRQVRLMRGKREVVYPADTQLVLAANPCACDRRDGVCHCTGSARANYLSNVSGPLRDRIDVRLNTSGASAVVHPLDAEPSATIAQRVAAARERAADRWAKAGVEERVNGRVPATMIRRDFPAEESGMAYLAGLLTRQQLTQRGVDRCLKLAWTLADLGGAERPGIDHIAIAVDMRSTDVKAVA